MHRQSRKEVLHIDIGNITILLVVCMVGLVGCTPPGGVIPQGTPTVNVAIALTPGRMTVFPEPSIQALTPSDHSGTMSLPNQTTGVGQIAEIEPLSARRYSVQHDYNELYSRINPVLLIHDSEAGKTIRLGDDSGDAIFAAMSDQYVLWEWGSSFPGSRLSGLYVLALETGQQFYVGNAHGVGIGGEWITYQPSDTTGYASLHARNLATGEDIVITNQLALEGPTGRAPVRAANISDINEEMIAWANYDADTRQLSLNVYDLANRTTHALNIPNLAQTYPIILNVGVSRTLVVWQEQSWYGYDLVTNSTFPIPLIPTGWENVFIEESGAVKVSAEYLYWWLKVNDEIHYFQAPVVRGGLVPSTPTAMPTATVVWTVTLPTSIPAEIPTDTPMPSETPVETHTPAPTDTPAPPPTDTLSSNRAWRPYRNTRKSRLCAWW